MRVAIVLGLLVAAGLSQKSGDSSDAQIVRLRAAGYMQLPGKAGGFSCGRCHFASSRNGAPFCGNANVQAYVDAESGCCNLFFPAGDPPVSEALWPAAGAIKN